jgi:hypothetical protein
MILLQLMVPSSALIVPDYSTIRQLHLFDTLLAVMLPFFGSAFGTFLMRQTFKTIPRDLDDAAKIDGANWLQTLWNVYIPPARPAMIAFALSSVSFHWNDFLWPLVVTNSANSRPLTVGLAVFTQLGEIGAQWPLVTADTIIVVGPLLALFLIFQRQFIESFLHSGQVKRAQYAKCAKPAKKERFGAFGTFDFHTITGSLYSPHVFRNTSIISLSVAYAFTASMKRGIKFARSFLAASRTAPSDACTFAPSRSRRMRCSRSA